MYIDKIKQVIELQREIKENNYNIISISMSEEKVLVRPELFKELFVEREYKVEFRRETYFYEGEFEGIKITSNNEKPIFDFISENINS